MTRRSRVSARDLYRLAELHEAAVTRHEARAAVARTVFARWFWKREARDAREAADERRAQAEHLLGRPPR